MNFKEEQKEKVEKIEAILKNIFRKQTDIRV